MASVKIFLTSWNRLQFLKKVVDAIEERTQYPHEIHVFDNNSEMMVQDTLYGWLKSGRIKSVHFNSENTGCLYNKIIFHSMVESSEEWYVVSDNDIIPPKLDPCWLTQLINLMEANPDLGVLTPQLPPTFLQKPNEKRGDIVLCKAVGNTLKIIRRSAFPVNDLQQKFGLYGDDGLVCDLMRKNGWKVGFAANLFCYNLERSEMNYGYTEEQLKADPRKSGYDQNARKYDYVPQNWNTLKPPENMIY